MQQVLYLEKNIYKDFFICLIGSILIALTGQIAIPLHFTPVPIVLQNAVVLLMAAFLGSKRGAATTFAFLAQGAMGLPVFAKGAGGMGVLLGPSGGYLFGYLIGAYVVGLLIERKKGGVFSLVMGNLIIYLFGMCYLATFISWEKAFLLGVAPFILGDLLKMMVSAKILRKI